MVASPFEVAVGPGGYYRLALIISEGRPISYVWRFGADWGGGFLNTMAYDTLISGHIAAGGDVFGQRQTLDGGNSWYTNNRGTTQNPDQTRAVAISKRPKTAGLTYWGTGNFKSAGAGDFFYTDFGDNALHPVGAKNGFGTGIASGQAVTHARRPVGPMIAPDCDGGASDIEYVYTITPQGFSRYVNAGANGAAISGPTLLAPQSAFGGAGTFWLCACVMDANNVAVVAWDGDATGAVIPTRIWMVHATDLRTTNAAGTTVSPVTISSSVNDSAGHPHIFDIKLGNDSVFYAACGYKGVAKVTLSTHDLSWTHITPSSGSTDLICVSADADSAGNIWIGQAGGQAGTTNYTNVHNGTPAGHGIVKATLSGGPAWAFTYPATSGGTIHETVFQPGDTTTASGGTWFLHGNSVSLTGTGYDNSLLRVDPFADAKVSSCGRSGMWQTRNSGTGFYFAGHGLNGTEITAIKVQSNSHASAGGAASDWAEVHTTDNWLTCVQGTSVAAGSGVAITGASVSYTGLSGAKYVLTQSTGFGGNKVTKQVGTGAVVDITDPLIQAASHLTGIAEAADGTVMVSTWGGVLVGDPGGTPTQPSITSFTPAAVSVGDTVTITGLRLTGMTSATVNGTQATSPTVVNSTTMTFVVPVGATTGFVGVSGPTGSAISSTALNVTATVPTISSFTPTHGLVGSTTVITGTNFTGVTDVRVNGVRASFTIQPTTHISLVIPVGATSGKLSVSGIQSSGTFTVDAGTPPPGNFDDGDAHLATSQHYFGTIDTLAHAQTLASTRAVITGQAELSAGGSNKFGTFAPAMLAANPNLWILPYMKSVVHAPQDPTMPEAYYAHTCAGSRIQTGTANLDTMQPDGTANFSDPRGFAATSYRDWKGQDCWKVVDIFEATYPNTLQGTYLDSLGTVSYANECNSGTPYTKPQWVNLIWTIPDHAVSQRPTGIVFCNGLQNAQAYYFTNTATGLSLAPLLTHCDGGVAERWLRDNYQAFGTWPALTGVNSWSNSVQMIIDADTIQNAYIWCVVNIANNVPGTQPAGFVAYTAGQINQWKRFSYCTFMLGQRGRALYEFVSSVTTKPWAETHTYWTTSLGTPLEATATTAGMLHSGLYRRLYTSGAVYVNPSAAGVGITADRNYLDPVSGASIASGSTITVAAHDGLLLTVDPGGGGGGNTAPVVAITSPAQGATILATTPVTLTVNATDSDGIASVTGSLDAGAGFALALATAPQYRKPLGLLQPGSHTIAVSATDLNASPLTSADAVTFTVSIAPPPANQPPSVFITGPADVIVLPATTLVVANATDVDGIASVTAVLDGGTPAGMAATSAGNYQIDLGALVEGSHRVDVKATDLNASPLSTTVSKTFLVTSNGGGDGGGGDGGGGGGDGGGDGGGGTGDGTPLVISTDIQDIEIRFKDRGLIG